MAFVTKDRVKDETTTTGTGALTLAGSPPTGFQAFSAIGDGNTCPYTIADPATGAWETGIGTYATAGPTLTRTTVLESSNAGAAVNFGAGTKSVFSGPLAGMVGYRQIGTTQTPTAVASSSITGIPATYSDLLIEIIGLSHDSGSNQTLRLETSHNGSTWTTAVVIAGTIAASGAWYGALEMPGYLKAAGQISTGVSGLSADNTSASANVGIAWYHSAGISAVRLSPAAGNFDGGSWKLWGK